MRRRPAGTTFADGRVRPGITAGQEHRASSRQVFIAWLAEVMAECRRLLKPGAHALVWALPRTSHWTATAIEDAGLEVRDGVHHLFAQGFPKSLDVAASIGRMARGTGGATKYVYKDPGIMATIGRNSAVAQIRGLRFSGFIGWVIWLTVHLINVISFRSRLIVLINWAWEYLFLDRPVRIIVRARE